MHEILGAWQLESRTVRKANGEILADPVLGTQPIGRLFYSASGHMMLQMMRRERAKAIGAPSNPQDANNPRVVLGYDAYFGEYAVDDARGTVTQRLVGALAKENVGLVLTRGMCVSGDELTIRLDTATADGEPIVRTLKWRRVG